MYDDLTWHSPPADWSVEGNRLIVVTGERTDFWSRTHYGFVRTNGHLLYREVAGDFTAEVTLHAAFDALYDQLGLMVRANDDAWLKAGLEFSDGRAQVSAVLPRDGWSDWSTSVASDEEVRAGLRVRLTRHGDVVRVQRRDRNGTWHLVRLGYLALPPVAQVGVMCCSPERAGFRAVFSDLVIGPAIARDLHEA